MIKWGDRIGAHGSDIISVNTKTGEVELWDSKFRSHTTTGKISPTFENKITRDNAINEAMEKIRDNNKLNPQIKMQMLENLKSGNFSIYTVGSGKVKSSVIQKYCNREKC